MRTLHYILFVTVAMLCFSCERMAQDVTPPRIESQLVVFSFLSPEDSLVKVEVSRSKPVYGSNNGTSGTIRDASVTIVNDAGATMILPYVDTLDAYAVSRSMFSIQPGRTYTVNVQSAGKTVSGKTTIPTDSVSLTDVTFLKLAPPSSGYDGPYFIYSYKWQDDAKGKNYYRVDIQRLWTFVRGGITQGSENVCNSIWDDENKNGGIISGTCEDYSWQSDQGEISVYLLNTDIHYYEYHRRRLNYYGDNPFSEPFQQYNNVEGGLGVVCSYRKSGKVVTVN